jgi:hypothetical protein
LSEPINVNITPQEKKDFWDIFKIIGVALIAPAVALAGHMYSNALKEKEVSAKYVELAVDILKQNTEDEKSNDPIRKWAIETINLHSQVKLKEDAKAVLKESPIIKEKLKVDFDVFLSSAEYNPQSMLRLTHVNHGVNTVTIDKVIVSGGNNSSCQKEFEPNTVVSAHSSAFTDLLTVKDLGDCLGTDNLLQSGFKPYGISTEPSMDIGAFKEMLSSYSTRNKPFFFIVEFSNSQSKGKFASGASVHFIK